jgi:malonyl-CoA O-methyltransferase
MGGTGHPHNIEMNYFKRLFSRPLQTLTSVNAYELWAQSYPAEAHNPLMVLEQEAMLSLMPDLAGKTVLDLACGTGRYGKIALKAGAKLVLGFDNSHAMLKTAVIPQIALASSEAIPLASNSLDMVISGLALGHLPRLEISLSEISRVLKPQGSVFISDFHPYQYLKGARRTFNDGKGKTYAVEHYVHHLSEYFTLGEKHRLRLKAVLEPQWQGNPVVLVLHYVKSEEKT